MPVLGAPTFEERVERFLRKETGCEKAKAHLEALKASFPFWQEITTKLPALDMAQINYAGLSNLGSMAAMVAWMLLKCRSTAGNIDLILRATNALGDGNTALEELLAAADEAFKGVNRCAILPAQNATEWITEIFQGPLTLVNGVAVRPSGSRAMLVCKGITTPLEDDRLCAIESDLGKVQVRFCGATNTFELCTFGGESIDASWPLFAGDSTHTQQCVIDGKEVDIIRRVRPRERSIPYKKVYEAAYGAGQERGAAIHLPEEVTACTTSFEVRYKNETFVFLVKAVVQGVRVREGPPTKRQKVDLAPLQASSSQAMVNYVMAMQTQAGTVWAWIQNRRSGNCDDSWRDVFVILGGHSGILEYHGEDFDLAVYHYGTMGKLLAAVWKGEPITRLQDPDCLMEDALEVLDANVGEAGWDVKRYLDGVVEEGELEPRSDGSPPMRNTWEVLKAWRCALRWRWPHTDPARRARFAEHVCALERFWLNVATRARTELAGDYKKLLEGICSTHDELVAFKDELTQ